MNIFGIAAEFGREDAESGNPALPELCLPVQAYEAYAKAYHAVRPTQLSAQLLGYGNFVAAELTDEERWLQCQDVDAAQGELTDWRG